MALFSSSEYQIGRGEVAESRVEVPFFIGFMGFSALALLVFHLYFQSQALTIALAVSLFIFAVTFLRVELGVYILVACMLLSPEIEASKGAGSRSLNLRYDDILIVVVFFGVLLKQAFEGRHSLWRSSPVNTGIFAYFSICILSSLIAYQRGLPLFVHNVDATIFVLLKMAEYYMVFILVGSAIRNDKQMRRQLIMFLVVAAIVSVYALNSRFISGEERVSAPFEKGGTEPNTLGGYLVIVACVAVALYTQAPTKQKRRLCLVLLALVFFPILYTLSRASYTALVAGMVALSLAARKYSIVAVVAVVLMLSPFIMPADVQKRVMSTFKPGGEAVYVGDVDTGLTVDKSTHERIQIWKKVRYNLNYTPWLGGSVEWDRILDSHYARVLIETGLIGCAAFIFLQWLLIKTSLQAYRWSTQWVGRAIGLAAFASTIALIVHSTGTISFLIVRIMEPFWFLIGLTVVARDHAIEDFIERRRNNQRLELESAPPHPPPSSHPVTTPVSRISPGAAS